MVNCNPGDVAIAVIDSKINGMLCNVIRLAQVGDVDCLGCTVIDGDKYGPSWHVEFHVPLDEIHFCLMYDRYLRPMKDN